MNEDDNFYIVSLKEMEEDSEEEEIGLLSSQFSTLSSGSAPSSQVVGSGEPHCGVFGGGGHDHCDVSRVLVGQQADSGEGPWETSDDGCWDFPEGGDDTPGDDFLSF